MPQLANFTNDAVLITEGFPIDGIGPRIVYCNPAFTRMTGYAEHEMLGLTPRLLQGPKTSRDTCDRIRRALRAREPIRVDLLNYRKDGSEFWVELSIDPVWNAKGAVDFWVSVQREASQLRRFDEHKRLYELILANLPDGVIVVDMMQPDEPVEFVNDGFLRMTGYPIEEVVGRNCRQFQGPDTDDEGRRLLRQAVSTGEHAMVELLNYRKDGSTFLNRISITPLHDAYGAVVKFVGLQRDVTGERERERTLVATQRLKAVGELTGGIAHDFNNLLTAIGGSAELLSQRSDQHPEAQLLVTTIRGAVAHGTSQVRRLLGFSRTPLLARGPVDLSAVLLQLHALLRPALRGNISLRMDPQPPSRWVDAEPAQLESALLNLVLNAQDAIVESGLIRIRVSDFQEAGAERVRIEIIDSGTGMSAATMTRIFEAFYTTKEPGRGSGLGLAMVQSFATQLGGRVEVCSTPGAGSTFALVLQAAQREAEASGDAGRMRTGSDDAAVADGADGADGADRADGADGADRADGADGAPDVDGDELPLTPARALHVLLAEDDDVVRLTVRAMLESKGHSVVACVDAQEALAQLAGDNAFDVLLTDLLMPGGMGGLELASLARQQRPDLKVVLASGWADVKLPAFESPEFGHAFLLKPFSLADLAGALARVMR